MELVKLHSSHAAIYVWLAADYQPIICQRPYSTTTCTALMVPPPPASAGYLQMGFTSADPHKHHVWPVHFVRTWAP